MKLLDKIKDLFMDDVTDDDEFEFEEDEQEEEKAKVKPAKNELPKVMRDTIKKEEKEEEPELELREFRKEPKPEPKVETTNKKFNFPIDVGGDVPTRNGRDRINEEIIRKFTEPKEEKVVVKTEAIEKTVHNEVTTHNEKVVHSSNINVLNIEREAPKKVAELYSKKIDDKNIKPKFKASPVISPVYGVLDKNYTKEEVKEKTEDNITMKRPSKKVDFETVRKKAFGNLADDIKDNLLCENCELYKEVKKISALREDDLLYDMTVDDEEEKEVTIEKAYDDYEEFGVAYEPKVEKRKPVLEETQEIEINDATSEKEEVEEEKTNDALENFSSLKFKISEEKKEEKPLEKLVLNDKKEEKEEKNDEVPSRSDKKKEEKVDEDFFELIDSMYKERVDD